MGKRNLNKDLFLKHGGIKLDLGCGEGVQKGFVGMDITPCPNVDIVHDVQKFPWPIPDNCCFQILMSHLWEHIEPKYHFRVMDECWRIVRHDGQLLIAAPYANSFMAMAHPEHYSCPNEACFQFFDPDFPLWQCSGYKRTLPWKIVRSIFNIAGTIEVVMEPRKDKKGNPVYPKG